MTTAEKPRTEISAFKNEVVKDFKDPADVAAMEAMIPLGRMGTPEDIADAVAYFLKGSDFVTGQILAVDGGLSLR